MSEAGGGGEAAGALQPFPLLIVPWRPDGGPRDKLWAFCRSRWEEGLPGAQIREAPSPPGPFNRAAAINAALRGPWECAVVLDADVTAAPSQILAAQARALETGRMTLGFEEFFTLREHPTQVALAGGAGWEKRSASRIHRLTHESSIVAIPRPLWELIGGFDERFEGWGQEDVAFCQAARILGGGIERVPGDVFHLWHPRSPFKSPAAPEWQAAQALGKRYRAASSPEEIFELLEEAAMGDRGRAFAAIYRRNGWNGSGSKAGPGSSPEATKLLARWLPRILEQLGAGSILDAGCGDAPWMPELPGYIGCDIVPEAVERQREAHPGREFRVLDICEDELPRCDAILCRDALQHLSPRDGMAALNNFRRSGAKWLLAGTHQGGANLEIRSGGFFEIDLEAAPFWLGEPLRMIEDGWWDEEREPWPNKRLAVWEL